MRRGEIHPFDREAKKAEFKRIWKGRNSALEAAKRHPITPEIQAALKTLHETGEAEVAINGVPVKMAYERITSRAPSKGKGGADAP